MCFAIWCYHNSRGARWILIEMSIAWDVVKIKKIKTRNLKLGTIQTKTKKILREMWVDVDEEDN